VKLDTLSMDSYTSFLLKGPWGFGKTIAAATFARTGPVFLSYWDKKGPIELVRFLKIHAPELLKNIEYEVYGAHNANEYLNFMFKLSRDCRYAAIINDSVTTMTSAAVNWSLGFKETKKARDQKNVSIPDFDEYKVETSLVTQALDICRTLPCHVIWIAHPLPSMKIEGTGGSMRISKVNSIVTYGSKVAGIIPGQFSEIYHFSKQSDWDQQAGKSRVKYLVSTEQIGDDYAKSNIGLSCEMDITDKLFYDVWRDEITKLEIKLAGGIQQPLPTQPPSPNPFANITQPTAAPTQPTDKKPWQV
jgi:hypothetical protein